MSARRMKIRRGGSGIVLGIRLHAHQGTTFERFTMLRADGSPLSLTWVDRRINVATACTMRLAAQ